MSTDTAWMARALQLAAEGLYTTQPNPRVGCVIVKDGRVVGEGFHARAGQPHAEVHALRQAGELAEGATAYVTLEPCAHYGRTPPCANALIQAKVARVVMASLDSNPLVAGKGRDMLEAVGIATTVGVLEPEAVALNAGFFRRMQGGLPCVRVKTAASLDGRTGMRSGESKWITGPDARRDVQAWRARSGAIITGIGTVLADDPALNVRAEDWTDWHYGEAVQPRRVVLDSGLRIPVDAKVLQGPGAVVVTRVEKDHPKVAELEEMGVEVWCLQGDSPDRDRTSNRPLAEGRYPETDRIDLHEVLHRLAQLGVNDILVEAGATVSGAFLQAGLVDELILYLAPTLLGSDARPMFTLPFLRMAEQQRLRLVDLRLVGADIRLIARPG